MREHMASIVAIQMKHLANLLADRKIELVLDDEATQWVANKGYDPAYGARPLKRVIQRYIQDPLSRRTALRAVFWMGHACMWWSRMML